MNVQNHNTNKVCKSQVFAKKNAYQNMRPTNGQVYMNEKKNSLVPICKVKKVKILLSRLLDR